MALSRSKLNSYEIQGQNYNPPPSGYNDKGVDKTGILDQWPAYSSQRNISANEVIVTNESNLLVVNEKYTKLPNLTPKPKFLQYLESYLKKELQNHKAEEIGSNPVRLDIYREVFDWLLEAFTTYKPILAEIKREYEVTIVCLKEQIRNLEPLKEMIWTVSEERNKEILKIKQIEKEEIVQLKAEKLSLNRIIGELEANQLTLQTQVERLKQDLQTEHQAYRNEADARKLLIIDINDLRQQLEDANMMKKTNEEESVDDPVVMKISLEEAKKCNTKLIAELNVMKTDYSDVVPKRDYDILLDKFEKLSEESADTIQKTDQLKVDHQALEEKFTALQQQRDFYYSKYMELARSSTPRPEWNKCSDAVSAGATWWNQQLKEKSSKHLMDLLLQEINMSSSITQEIDAKGNDSSVLSFLRAEGKVCLRFMPKRDVKIHINKIWTDRKVLKEEQMEALSKSQDYKMPTLADTVDLFFRKTYGIEQIRLEWAYTFYQNISEEKTNDFIRQFYRMLTGEMDEDIYWEDMMLLNKLLDQLRIKDLESRNLMPKEDFIECILSVFVKKPSEESISKVMNTIISDTKAGQDDITFPYQELFLMSEEGDYGSFVNEIRQLYNEDKEVYVKEIEKEIRDVGSKIDAAQLRECFLKIDPEIPNENLEKSICWCFETATMEDAIKQDPIGTDIIVYRLNMGAIKRHSFQ